MLSASLNPPDRQVLDGSARAIRGRGGVKEHAGAGVLDDTECGAGSEAGGWGRGDGKGWAFGAF